MEVEILNEKGRSDIDLTPDVKLARGYELQPGELGGQASQAERDEIWDYLMNEKVLCTGVWARGALTKTSLEKHVPDQIVQNCRRFPWCFLGH